MGKLLMSYKKIRNSIELKENNWKNTANTNCYAFALGIDIPYYDLLSSSLGNYENAYNVGIIGGFKYGISWFEIIGARLEDRLFLDLDALNIKHKEASQNEIVTCSPKELNWLIAMYKDKKSGDFHFLRKINNNSWAHKLGTYRNISYVDANDIFITNLDTASFNYHDKVNTVNYELEKVYKLTLKK